MPKKTASADWTPKTIHKHLEDAGWTMDDLAKHYCIAYTTLADALYRVYPRSQERIATAIGVKPETIWPSRYDTQGRPISGVGFAKKRAFNTVNKPRTKRKHHKSEAIGHEHPK